LMVEQQLSKEPFRVLKFGIFPTIEVFNDVERGRMISDCRWVFSSRPPIMKTSPQHNNFAGDGPVLRQ
jgi:hypothetical protein